MIRRVKGGFSYASQFRSAGADSIRSGRSARRQNQAASRIDKRTFSVLLICAFALAFALSFAAFHYKEAIASALSEKGISWPAEPGGAVGAAASAAEGPPQRRFAVQVAASESRAEADALARRLAARHKEVFVSRAGVKGKVYYRVRIPAETGAEADRLAATLRRELNHMVWVVYLP